MFDNIVSKSRVWRKGVSWDWALYGAVVLVGVGAFGLGRLSVLLEQKPAVRVYAPEQGAAALVGRELARPSAAAKIPTVPANEPHVFVASKNGTKYYPAGCTAAGRIKPENQVWFGTAARAESLGYTASSACKTTR